MELPSFLDEVPEETKTMGLIFLNNHCMGFNLKLKICLDINKLILGIYLSYISS